MSSSYPDRCQHLKTNGTQCGSPALRRNRFCYFHKRYQEERIRLGVDRRRRGTATFFLPVLEDANSIQMSLMQIMRLLLTGQIEHKTASLLLYALQTASTNLRQANFNPRVHDVILDPRDAAESPLNAYQLWEDDDFEDDDEEVDEQEREIQQKEEAAARKARHVARWEAEKEIEAREKARKRLEQEEKAKIYVAEHPEFMLVRRDGGLFIERRPKQEPVKKEAAPTTQAAPKPATPAPAKAPEPGTPESAAQVREQIVGMIREAAPALTKAYNAAMKKESEQTKKPPQKETRSADEKKSSSSSMSS
jgi:hypothetical protein